jgi:glutamine amidotransferase
MLDGIVPESTCYFVHSFTAGPADDQIRLAECDCNGRRISAALRVGSVYGTQFHVEKSAQVGLHILRNFHALTRVNLAA